MTRRRRREGFVTHDRDGLAISSAARKETSNPLGFKDKPSRKC